MGVFEIEIHWKETESKRKSMLNDCMIAWLGKKIMNVM